MFVFDAIIKHELNQSVSLFTGLSANCVITGYRPYMAFHRVTVGVFDFMQRHENRSAADLKCMPVRKFVRLEPAPTPHYCHVWHQSTAIAFREQPAHSAGAVSPERLRER